MSSSVLNAGSVPREFALNTRIRLRLSLSTLESCTGASARRFSHARTPGDQPARRSGSPGRPSPRCRRVSAIRRSGTNHRVAGTGAKSREARRIEGLPRRPSRVSSASSSSPRLWTVTGSWARRVALAHLPRSRRAAQRCDRTGRASRRAALVPRRSRRAMCIRFSRAAQRLGVHRLGADIRRRGDDDPLGRPDVRRSLSLRASASSYGRTAGW